MVKEKGLLKNKIEFAIDNKLWAILNVPIRNRYIIAID